MSLLLHKDTPVLYFFSPRCSTQLS